MSPGAGGRTPGRPASVTSPGRQARQGTSLFLLALLGYGAVVHHGVGPSPLGASPESAAPWWAPRGFLLELLADSALAPLLARPLLHVLALTLPALVLAALVFAWTRAVLARTLALAAVLAVGLFAFYGGGPARLVWSFFHWRGSAVMVTLAALTAAFALAPLWVARVRAWHVAPRVGVYGVACLTLLELQRSVTGTDPTLPLAVSPWPVLPVFGVGVAVPLFAALFAGLALGLAGLALLTRGSGPAPRVGGAVLLAAGVAIVPLGLRAGALSGLLPFGASTGTTRFAAALAALAIAAAAWGPWRRAPALRARAALFAFTAVLLAVPTAGGRLLERWDYAETREERASRLIEALESYFERQQLYPDSLTELVEARDLVSVPRPRLGLLGAQEFVYQSFGTSYLLEFSAPRWVQCQYNPPFEDEETAEDEADLGEGSWSCPSQPPELW